MNKWIRELREFGNPDIVLVIVGNKCDLEGQRQVNKEQAENFAKEVGAMHFLGSAKSGTGIQELFKSLSTRNHLNFFKEGKIFLKIKYVFWVFVFVFWYFFFRNL